MYPRFNLIIKFDAGETAFSGSQRKIQGVEKGTAQDDRQLPANRKRDNIYKTILNGHVLSIRSKSDVNNCVICEQRRTIRKRMKNRHLVTIELEEMEFL